MSTLLTNNACFFFMEKYTNYDVFFSPIGSCVFRASLVVYDRLHFTQGFKIQNRTRTRPQLGRVGRTPLLLCTNRKNGFLVRIWEMGLGLALFEMSFNKRIVKKKKMRRRRWSYQTLRDRFSKKMGLGLAFFETSFNKRIVKKEKMGRRRCIYQSLGDGLSQKIWDGDGFGLALRDGFSHDFRREEDGLGFRSRRRIFLEDSRRKRIRRSWVWVWEMGFQRRFEKK